MEIKIGQVVNLEWNDDKRHRLVSVAPDGAVFEAVPRCKSEITVGKLKIRCALDADHFGQNLRHSSEVPTDGNIPADLRWDLYPTGP